VWEPSARLPPVEINIDTVRALAALARLKLDDGELERMRDDLAAMLAYVEQLEELDVSGVPPTAHVLDIATPLRDDAVTRRLPAEEAVRNAPARAETAYVVPKVID